jgi:hypothetical protein
MISICTNFQKRQLESAADFKTGTLNSQVHFVIDHQRRYFVEQTNWYIRTDTLRLLCMCSLTPNYHVTTKPSTVI